MMMGGMGMMGMGMMPPLMPGMGVPMGMGMGMPMGMPTPGVMPGVPGQGWYNSMPGRFGRDMLGRGAQIQPYRPPDPSTLPPMPAGIPFIARPGQEGFDAYGRQIPPELPEGWDGWGRPIVSGTTPAPPALPGGASGAMPPNVGPQGMPNGQGLHGGMPGVPAPMPSAGTRDTALSTMSETSEGTGRPEQPPCFDRPPAQADGYSKYNTFEPFSLPAKALNKPHLLHVPPELVGHDVTEEDWSRFISDLSKEAITGAQHDFAARSLSVSRGGSSGADGPRPVLSEAVHTLLASWAVAFFLPRGIRMHAAQNGQRVIPPSLDHDRSGKSRAWDYSSDDDSSPGDASELDALSDDEEEQARRNDMYLPRRERAYRARERERERRRRRRRRFNEERLRKKGAGEWEVHFASATPTVWQPGLRPRTYGEPVIRARRA
ncbi:hypothetical protein Q5752_000090 [Cryptotrichosporon argae]